MQTRDLLQTVVLAGIGYAAWQYFDVTSRIKDTFGPPEHTSSVTAPKNSDPQKTKPPPDAQDSVKKAFSFGQSTAPKPPETKPKEAPKPPKNKLKEHQKLKLKEHHGPISTSKKEQHFHLVPGKGLMEVVE